MTHSPAVPTTSRIQLMASASMLVAVMLVVCLPFATPVSANSFSSHDEIVSTNPAQFTPDVLDGKVLAIAPIDADLVVVGGDFTQVRDASGVTINMPYIFAFRRSTGLIDRTFDPVLNNEVSSLVAGADESSIYVGGFFTTVNGQTNRKGLTRLDLAGDRIIEFKGRTNARVKDLALINDVLYVAGTFTSYSSAPAELLVAADARTGELLPDFDFDFADEFSTERTRGALSIDEIDISSDGSTLVAIGNFGTVDFQERNRLAVFDLSGPSASLSPWATSIYSFQCGSLKPQYVTDIDIAPDDSYFVVVSSGGYGGGNPACDTAHRFNFADVGGDVQPAWTNYSGGDTYLGVAISGEVVYVGGHFRWLNNPFQAGQQGAGSVPRRGFAALDPLNGLPLTWRADRSPRGIGTYEVLIDNAGVWIGDDTDNMSFEFHPRLKYLPLDSQGAVPRPSEPVLPTTIFAVNGSSLIGSDFDGSTVSNPVSVATGTWADTRGMLFLGGVFFYGSTDGNFYARSFDGTAPGAQAGISLNGLTEANFPLARLGGMYFDHDLGRIYYTVEGDSNLYYRYFTPESSTVGAISFMAPASTTVPWADVRGMDRVDDQLYYGLGDGTLYRVTLADNTPVGGTTVPLSGPRIDGRDWSGRALAFLSDGQLFNPTPNKAEFDFSSTGSASSGSWQVFSFPAEPGEPINVQLSWDNPDATLNVFLRDPAGNTVVRNITSTSSPKWLNTTTTFGGSWSVAVKIKEGATNYDVLVNPIELPPAPRAEHEFSSTACDNLNSFQTFNFPVSVGDNVQVTLEWDDPSAQVNIFLRDETRSGIERDSTFNVSPKTLSAFAGSAGNWSAAVKVKQGCTDFEVLVNSEGGDTSTPVPVSHWALDGDFLDSEGRHDGFAVFSPDFENPAAECHYAVFDGSANQFISVPYTPELNTNNFTVSLWARSDGGANTRAMLASRWETAERDNRFGWAVYETGLDRWMWLTGEGATDHGQPGSNLAEGVWTHIAFTFEQTGVEADGMLTGKKRFYINGSQVDQRNGWLQVNDTGPLTIGSRSIAGKIGNANRYIGAIDEVQVFDQVLDGAGVNRVRFAHPGCSGL